MLQMPPLEEHLMLCVDAALCAGVARGDNGVAGLLPGIEQRSVAFVAPTVAAAAALQPWQPAYLMGHRASVTPPVCTSLLV